MRARSSSFALLSWLLASTGQGVAASHSAPGRFVPIHAAAVHVIRDTGHTNAPGLNYPVAPPMRTPALTPVVPLTPALPAMPVAPKIERASPDGARRPDFPSPEPSPFSNPLHRLLMASAFGAPPI